MTSDNYQPDWYDAPEEAEITLVEQMREEAEWAEYYEAYLAYEEPV